jgi:hypothetical protein
MLYIAELLTKPAKDPASQQRNLQVLQPCGGGTFLPWAATAAAFAFLFAAGVFITLETQKGQLVIESIDANVEIMVSKAGKVYDSVQLLRWSWSRT